MPNPAVKARQSLMTLFAFNLGTLGAMAQGNMEYDATAAGAAANNLMALSHLDLAALWPEGTDADSIDGTRALPDLWANFPDVTTKIAALQTATTAMADAAGTDLAGLQGAMGPLGAACGACHQAYRASE
ncbi:cytochrome c-554 [Sinisalibacter aestuarii]|uniref:Cytochrome c-554 n=2 Tax=Sinisalibacter aestuarii TaxID=2949426 RepID=A0ABQ5LUC3_9RHOB|nr:cytochrome c-554 [Sinisalibacter aestuarii]